MIPSPLTAGHTTAIRFVATCQALYVAGTRYLCAWCWQCRAHNPGPIAAITALWPSAPKPSEEAEEKAPVSNGPSLNQWSNSTAAHVDPFNRAALYAWHAKNSQLPLSVQPMHFDGALKPNRGNQVNPVPDALSRSGTSVSSPLGQPTHLARKQGRHPSHASTPSGKACLHEMVTPWHASTGVNRVYEWHLTRERVAAPSIPMAGACGTNAEDRAGSTICQE